MFDTIRKQLTEAQRAKARACQTPEEMLAFAHEEGYELSDDELACVAGGVDWSCNDQNCSSYDPEPHSR